MSEEQIKNYRSRLKVQKVDMNQLKKSMLKNVGTPLFEQRRRTFNRTAVEYNKTHKELQAYIASGKSKRKPVAPKKKIYYLEYQVNGKNRSRKIVSKESLRIYKARYRDEGHIVDIVSPGRDYKTITVKVHQDADKIRLRKAGAKRASSYAR